MLSSIIESLVMSKISRKEFLGYAFKASALALAHPWSKAQAISAKTPSYQAIQLQRFEWYCRNVFDFKSQLSKLEKQYIHTCIEMMDQWAFKVDEKLSLSTVSYSHQVRGQQCNSSRLAIGSVRHQQDLADMHVKILEANGIDPSSIVDLQHLAGLGWDFKNRHLKLYFYYPDRLACKNKDVNALLPNIAHSSLYPLSLSSLTYRNGEPYESKAYLYFREPLNTLTSKLTFSSDIKHTTHMISSRRATVAQVDLNGSERLQLAINDKGRQLLRKFNHLSWQADTVAFQTRDQYTLYF